jgi:hypothetical protein
MKTNRRSLSLLNQNDKYFLIAIAGLFVLSLFVVNPIGDFPLNDDWSYGLA